MLESYLFHSLVLISRLYGSLISAVGCTIFSKRIRMLGFINKRCKAYFKF